MWAISFKGQPQCSGILFGFDAKRLQKIQGRGKIKIVVTLRNSEVLVPWWGMSQGRTSRSSIELLAALFEAAFVP
jgi:hypothetical protein